MLPLIALEAGRLPAIDAARYDNFHLLLATPDNVQLMSARDGALDVIEIQPGRHTLTTGGLDTAEDYLTSFRDAMLPGRPAGNPARRIAAELQRRPVDRGAGPLSSVVIARSIDARAYGTSSAAYVKLDQESLSYTFARWPFTSWKQVL